MARNVECCPHYHRQITTAEPEEATCKLLQRVTGVEDDRLYRVSCEACIACCEESLPSETHLNPTLASLLFSLTTRLLDGDTSAAGYDYEQVVRLRGWAEENLFLGADPAPALPQARIRRLIDSRGRWNPPLRIGLIGGNAPSGLGSLNRAIAKNLVIDRWLIVAHPFLEDLPEIPECRVCRETNPAAVRDFLDGLDWLLFCECPQLDSVVAMAREMGIRIACVPMWEHLDELSPWIRAVDLMICPTRYCHTVLEHWRERLGLDLDLALVSWPIDLDQFTFRPRTVCNTFLFINGLGGMGTMDQSSPNWDGRKGLGIIGEAAKRAPSVPILVRTQASAVPLLPANVEVRRANLTDAAELYTEGDVCVQPSRWEGLGLPLLECQASGLPLITTDAPPMNEHDPLLAVPASATKARLFRHRAIPVHEVDPDDLARVLLNLHGADISEASLTARRYVEAEHSWTVAGPRILDLLSQVSAQRDR
ncbi:glycosyltransferase [Singulisphaera acidiphila]|uniref:Glycosyltransferase n=1 Tax=Singulisphaera acidiphila (strain ATCC BAA-1392 / DSM 18658 / VKM B-2454 / MOB10) TaxID=886293 RepID=L0DEI7_SINAD|nr:glycosyltransferase [Singulisphaera acidiphila]AGA27672.1 glycosyltransferase [Singulisphaera acidiphila DSM 18658]